jgi:hypothetical protein
MSLFSWFAPKKKSAKSAPESSGLSRMQATLPVGKNGKPLGREAQAANGQPANRKSERMARRELLYTVVRECMVRAGVLSASYKFKVLSLDARGRQFLVMVDVAREYGGESERFAEIEAAVAQSAKSRYDIVVTAVYWRMNDHVAVGLPTTLPHHGTPSRPAPLDSRPAALDSGAGALDSQPASLSSSPVPLAAVAAVPAAAAPAVRPAPITTTAAAATPSKPAPLTVPRSPGGRFEPIADDEVAAFKKALASGIAASTAVAQPAPIKPSAPAPVAAAPAKARAFDGSAKAGPQSYTLLTGFEDTEMPDADPRAPALSATQYGELR